jgi:hypothetical protein
MAKIVSLNRFRKEKERAAKTATASENRAAYGRTKADKKIEKAREDKVSKTLDQHQLDKNET